MARHGKEQEEEAGLPGLGQKKTGIDEAVVVSDVLGLGTLPKPKYSRLRQQELPAATLMLTVKRVIIILFGLGMVFVPLGAIFLEASKSVVEIVERYDDQCLAQHLSNPLADDYFLSNDSDVYIRDVTSNKTCSLSVKIPKKMKKPIFIYYEIFGLYQNHAGYVKSMNAEQLRGQTVSNSTIDSSCKPRAFIEQAGVMVPILPCGLIAWTNFNDTFVFDVNGEKVEVSANGLAWEADKNFRFGKEAAANLNTDSALRGGGTSTGPLNQDERLMVWMRIATLRRFRKLWGRINDVDIEGGKVLNIQIENQFNTYAFGGEKRLVLSTTSWLGGSPLFIGVAYLTVGLISFFFAFFFFIANWRWPRPLGDPSYLSWNRNPLGPVPTDLSEPF